MNDFGWAIRNIKLGYKSSRYAWTNRYIIYIPPDNSANQSEYIAVKNGEDQLTPWIALQSDILAFDWYKVET